MDVRSISTHCARTEFVGTTVLDTIGLVISGIDPQLLKEMNIGTRYHALGLLSSRTGAAGQITAVDDAVKATSTEVLSIDLPRDTKGWGGHGNYIVLGGNDVSDVRQAIEIALERTAKYAGELYISQSGHLEFAYSASAGAALTKAFGAVPGQAFGFMAGSPAAIGLCHGGYRREVRLCSDHPVHDAQHRHQPLQRSDPGPLRRRRRGERRRAGSPAGRA